VKNIAVLTNVDITKVIPARKVQDGGFCQRGLVGININSKLYQNMIKNGYDTSGSLIMCEIPYGEAEVKELKEKGLVGMSWEPPLPLRDQLDPAAKEGGTWFDVSVEYYRYTERRFAMMDGSHRSLTLATIRMKIPDFEANKCFMVTLADVNPLDSLQVQMHGMKCNLTAHHHIFDNFGDKLQQYKSVLACFNSIQPGSKKRKVGMAHVANFIAERQGEGQEFEGLLPKESGNDKELKSTQIMTYIRLVSMLDSDFIQMVQEKLAGNDGEGGGLEAWDKQSWGNINIMKMSLLYDCFDNNQRARFLDYRCRSVFSLFVFFMSVSSQLFFSFFLFFYNF
jgi:hypothetical protein